MKGGLTSYLGLIFGFVIVFTLYGMYLYNTTGNNQGFDLWSLFTTCTGFLGTGLGCTLATDFWSQIFNMLLSALTSPVGIISGVIIANTLGQFSMMFILPLSMVTGLFTSFLSGIMSRIVTLVGVDPMFGFVFGAIIMFLTLATVLSFVGGRD